MDELRVEYAVAVEGLNVLRVRDFTLREALSEPYELRCDVVVPDDTDLEALLGQDLVFTMTRGDEEERVAGLVTEVRSERESRADAGELHLSLRVQPALAMLALRRNSRIFQEKTVEEIVQAVLDEAFGPYGRSAELSLEGSYEPREYCVQYEESDLDFVHRLLEEEGIHYQFDHEGDIEKMLLGDSNGAFTDAGAIDFVAAHVGITESNAISVLRPRRRAAVTHVQLRDWNFLSAAEPIGAEAGEEDPDFAGERRIYDHGIDRKLTPALLSARATPRVEAHRLAGRTSYGTSHAIKVRAGRIFALNGSPTLGADGSYLVTSVTHGTRTEELRYESHFDCIPSETVFRPARVRSRPLIEGVEAATVVGPAGEEIHPDEHGRVKVLFAWDRVGPGDETSSCWIRVEQPWAGDGWGWMFIPRIGMEVVVQFVDGNPDRPLITGCVYNGEKLPPYPLPDEKTKSTFKTESSIGGGGFNELRFEDKAGQEQVFTHAQKDFDEEVLNCHTTDVGHDQTNTVDGNQTQEIGADQKETVDANQMMVVDGKRTVHVKSNFEEKVTGAEVRIVSGSGQEDYGATELRIVIGGVDETVAGHEQMTVDGAKTETLIGGHNLSVTGNHNEEISSISTTQAATIDLSTPATSLWKGSSAVDVSGSAKIDINAPPAIIYNATSFTEKSAIQMKLGVTNIGITWSLWSWSWGACKIGLLGGSVGATGVSVGATGASVSVTAKTHKGKKAASATAAGIILHLGGVVHYAQAEDVTL